MINVKGLVAALESTMEGKPIKELEYVFFGLLRDLDALKSMAVETEHQHQYSISKPNGSIRVRAVNHEHFELTTKTWVAGVAGKQEETNPTTATQRDHFQAICDSSMEKNRYIVIVPGTEGTWKPTETNPNPKYNGSLFWEFDVFVDANGNDVDWVKVDLEVPDETIAPSIPPLLEDVIVEKFGVRPPEHVDFIRSLYSEKFTK